MNLVEKACAALTAGLVLSIPYFAFAAPGQWLMQTGGVPTTAGPGTVTVVATNFQSESAAACNTSCTPFSITTSAGNTVYILIEELEATSASDWTINCNGSAATMVIHEVHTGANEGAGWIYECPAASGALSITATKASNTLTSFGYAEMHSSIGTPSSDGSASAHTNTTTVTATFGSPTTVTTDVLLATAYQSGASAGTMSGGGAGAWSDFTGSTTFNYQTETTTAAFSVTSTSTGGTTGGYPLVVVAVKP